MRPMRLLLWGLVLLSMTTAGVFAADADKAKRRTEIQKMAQTALPEFYKAEPKLKAAVEKAPGYAVFSTFGLSFIVGGGGGKGLARDNRTGKVTYMQQGQASVGFQAGIAESRTLLIFKNAASMKRFIDEGWDVGAGGGVRGAIEGKGAGGAAGGGFTSETEVYTLTRNGLQAGVAVAGTKFWRDDELN